MRNHPAINLLSLILVGTTIAVAQSPTTGIPAIAKAANGAVVSVVTLDKNTNPIAQGTGFFVSDDGLLLTNFHVIADANAAVVKFPDGKISKVDGVFAFDKTRDVAVIKVHGNHFKTLTLGDSSRVQVGEKVVAIGNPLFLESTVSDGIISGIRTGEQLGGKFLQTTAPISHGSSGGPLLNMDGEVIGITTMFLKGGENLNFAVPINYAKQLLYESEGPISSANLTGSYMCDTDVIPMHLALKVTGKSLVMTIITSSGNEGEMYFRREGRIWTDSSKEQFAAESHTMQGPTAIFSVDTAMRFLLANTFAYDKSRGQIFAGIETTGYPEYLTLSGICKSAPKP